MENKNAPTFSMTILAVIMGIALFKQFDFATQKFEKPALAIVYFIGLAISIYLIFGKPKGQSKQ